MNWPTTNALPPMPNVTLRFGGLLGFCYCTRSGECEIGFHHGDGRHRVEVVILENGREIYPLGNLPNIRTMGFGVEGKNPNVNFLKLSPDPFDREHGHDQDFRWMLDLEGTDFYPEKPEKDLNFKFKAKLLVTQGTIFTKDKTQSTFNRVSTVLGTGGFDPQPLFYVSKEMAATLRLAETEVAFVEINGEVVKRLPGTAGKEYEVRFGNTCRESSGGRCEWTPGSTLERWRNDFRFHRDIFSLPLDRARYGLMLDRPGPIEVDNSKAAPDWRPFGTDRAPCMGVSYGETNGFPQ